MSNVDDVGVSRFLGILVDATQTLSVITQEVNADNPYTVEEGKKLYVTSYLGNGGDAVIENLAGTSTTFTGTPYSQPWILNSGESIKSSNSNNSGIISAFNGYLVDEDYFADCGGGGSSEGGLLNNIGFGDREHLDINGFNWQSLNGGWGFFEVFNPDQDGLFSLDNSCGNMELIVISDTLVEENFTDQILTDNAIFKFEDQDVFCAVKANEKVVFSGLVPDDENCLGATWLPLISNTSDSSEGGSGGISVSQYGDTLFMEDQYIIIPSLSTYNQHIYQPQFGSVSDISNNTYQTLIYGSNEWMIENLRSSHFADGTTLTVDSDVINNGEDYEEVYGNLYHYSAMMDSRNVCPTGWHVSTKNDWEDLINYFIPNSDFSDHYWVVDNDNILKTLRSNSLWGQSVGTNQEFFNIVPAGYGFNTPTILQHIGISAHFWTSTVDTAPNPGDQIYILTDHYSYNINLSVYAAGQGYKSIRCVKD